MPSDASQVCAAPEDVSLRLMVEDVLKRVSHLSQIAARGMDDASGLVVSSRDVEQEQRMLRRERLRFVLLARHLDRLMPPHVSAGDPIEVGFMSRAADNEHVLDGFAIYA